MRLDGGESVIDIDNLTMRYPSGFSLSQVSLSVQKGSVYALVGRNGAGKSTLIRCLLGVQRQTSGAAMLLGRSSWEHRTTLMEQVAVVPEDPDVPPEMTALQVSRFCSRLYKRWDGKSLEDRLNRFGVPLRVSFGKLSKGQKRQVALAVALASSPELLILDDPTLGLDVVARKAVFEEVIGELADRGITLFLTTHDLAGVETLADHVGILHKGKLVFDQPLELLKQRFRRLRYTSSSEPQSSVVRNFKVVRARSIGSLAEAVVSDFEQERFDGDDGMVEAEAMSLEEIFLAVMSDAEGNEQ